MLVETDDQRTARLQLWRSQDALRQAPDIAEYVRSLAVDGKPERGEVLPEYWSPMRLAAVDACDALYAQILNWVAYFSEELQIVPPATFPVAWSNLREAQGFKAHTTPAGAHMLVNIQTMWLLGRGAQINAHPSADAFQKDVIELVFSLRGKYPMAPRGERKVMPRACPVCGELAVGAEWFTPDPLDVKISCEVCGYEMQLGEGWMMPAIFDDEEEL